MGNIDPLSAAMAGLNILSSHQQGRAQLEAARADAARREAEVRRQTAVAERQRRDQLKRDLASRRAAFGAAGLRGGGSTDAVLAGIERQAGDGIRILREDQASELARMREKLAARKKQNLLKQRALIQDTALDQIRKVLPRRSLI